MVTYMTDGFVINFYCKESWEFSSHALIVFLERKVALQSIWSDLPQDPIVRSILRFTKRLRACVKASDKHFECDLLTD